jgi:NADH-quinone oxidoreductase subunit M
LAALYILIPVQRALHGKTAIGNEILTDLTTREKIAIAPVLAIIILLGIFPKPVLDLLNPTAKTVISNNGYSDPASKVKK